MNEHSELGLIYEGVSSDTVIQELLLEDSTFFFLDDAIHRPGMTFAESKVYTVATEAAESYADEDGQLYEETISELLEAGSGEGLAYYYVASTRGVKLHDVEDLSEDDYDYIRSSDSFFRLAYTGGHKLHVDEEGSGTLEQRVGHGRADSNSELIDAIIAATGDDEVEKVYLFEDVTGAKFGMVEWNVVFPTVDQMSIQEALQNAEQIKAKIY